MSLLMDALKKAEKDKKKAVSEAEGKTPEIEESAEESTQRLDSDPPLETTQETVDREEVTERLEAYEMPTTRSEFSLEPMDAPAPDDLTNSLELGETSDEFDPGSLSISGSGDISQSGEYESATSTTTTGGHTITRENTLDSTMPSERVLKDDLNDYFEASLSMQRTQANTDAVDETLSRTVVQTGVGDSSQVTAETVFVAGKAKQKKSSTTPILIIVLLLVLMSGAGLYLYTLAPQKSLVPPPRVASQIQPSAVPAPPEQLSEVIVPGPTVTTEPVASEPDTGMPTISASETEQSVGGETLADTETSEPVDEVQTDPLPVEPMVSPAETMPTPLPAAVVKTEEPKSPKLPAEVADSVVDTSPYQAVKHSTTDVQISKSRKSNAVSTVLHSAYLAYQAGNDNVAAAAYRSVLSKQHDNRDALLGLAVLAIKSGNLEQAYGLYRKLLKLNPNDSVAATALFSLQGYKNSPVVTESRLKLQLDEDPNASHIHFSLGNLYARQTRWAKAQQSFFEAYRIDNENADYIYNLAVSLDQLQQHRAALDYYRLAYNKANDQTVSFPVAQLMTRIQSLAAKFDELP